MLFQTLANELSKAKEEIQKQVNQLELSLQNVPNGNIRISQNNGKPRYYLRSVRGDRNGKYVSDLVLIGSIAQKDYNRKVLTELTELLKHVNKLQKCLSKTRLGHFRMSDDRIKLIIRNPIELSDDDAAELWKNIPYETKKFSAQQVEHYTQSGVRVCSKSEVMIGDLLDKYEIPYRYQQRIVIKGRIIHPDFICYNRRLRKVFIWEHNGMMDSVEYANEFIRRQDLYLMGGYKAGEKLIQTFESSNRPLNNQIIENTIKMYLL